MKVSGTNVSVCWFIFFPLYSQESTGEEEQGATLCCQTASAFGLRDGPLTPSRLRCGQECSEAAT